MRTRGPNTRSCSEGWGLILSAMAIDSITEADLQHLVEAAVQESDRVEFKRDMYGRADEGAREMLRDIAAMANHQGGDIYIGIDEDDDGVARELSGISEKKCDERIVSSCQSSIEPRLHGLQAQMIPLDGGKSLVVVRVPQSLAGPHMITHRGLNQFWKRHGRQKDKMSIDEIRLAFLIRGEAETRLERFLLSREIDWQREISNRGWLLLTATPQHLAEESVDVRSASIRHLLSAAPPVGRFARSVSCGSPVPTLWGLRSENGQAGNTHTYLELHRTGHLEYGSSLFLRHSLDAPGQVPSLAFLDYLRSFVELAKRICVTSGIATPWAFGSRDPQMHEDLHWRCLDRCLTPQRIELGRRHTRSAAGMG